jgi:hypothetical protein
VLTRTIGFKTHSRPLAIVAGYFHLDTRATTFIHEEAYRIGTLKADCHQTVKADPGFDFWCRCPERPLVGAWWGNSLLFDALVNLQQPSKDITSDAGVGRSTASWTCLRGRH